MNGDLHLSERIGRLHRRTSRAPGDTPGAKRLYDILYSDDWPEEKRATIEAVAEAHNGYSDPVTCAASLLGKWATGIRRPEPTSRLALWRVAGIHPDAWGDEPVTAVAGANKGARLLFGLAFSGTESRERTIAEVQRILDASRARAWTHVMNWACGRCAPRARTRHALESALGIPSRAWDESTEAQ